MTMMAYGDGTRRLSEYPRLRLPPAVLDAEERFLVLLWLRRYVTWCARKGQFDRMTRAARLHQRVLVTKTTGQ